MRDRVQIRSLINEVITNAVRSIRSEEFEPFKKLDETRGVHSKVLAEIVQRLNPKAKKVTVSIERVYERKKRDYFTTLTVAIDNKAELHTQATFTNYIIARI